MEPTLGRLIQCNLQDWRLWPGWALTLAVAILSFKGRKEAATCALLLTCQTMLLALAVDFLEWLRTGMNCTCAPDPWPFPGFVPAAFIPVMLASLLAPWRGQPPDRNRRRLAWGLGATIVGVSLTTFGAYALLWAPFSVLDRLMSWFR